MASFIKKFRFYQKAVPRPKWPDTKIFPTENGAELGGLKNCNFGSKIDLKYGTDGTGTLNHVPEKNKQKKSPGRSKPRQTVRGVQSNFEEREVNFSRLRNAKSMPRPFQTVKTTM